MLNVAAGRSDSAMRDISLQGISLNQCRQVAETLGAVWRGEKAVEQLLQERGESGYPAHLQRRSSPSEIRIDSASSDYAIIVDIRVPDRVGLLYTISNVFYELGLGIRLAKVTTRAYTAIDSFYVTEEDGTKTTSPDRIAAVKRTLAETLGHPDIIETTS
jgi:[protein-PII] uridylyltransferase